MLIAAPTPAIDPQALLRSRLAGFAGFLHANGYGVGGGDSARVLETASLVGVLDPQVLRWSLKALLCGRGDEWRRFDALFDAYFLPANKTAFTAGFTSVPGTARGSTEGEQDTVPGAANVEGGTDDGESARHGASREESLTSTDFSELNRGDHIRDIETLMRRFARRMKHLRLRREAIASRGRRLDLRGTIRRSVSTGGTPVRLSWRERRRVRPRLILLLDVSRSMSLYSFFFMRLARALCAELADVHCFIFHTRITPIGEALRDQDPRRSQERLHLLAEGWAGGTRIGECLADFNRDYASRLVHSRTGVIVVSDGYDTGEPEMLGHALAQIRRRARRLIWVNPLLEQTGFRPESRGMQAAIPHVDLLAPGHDLASIERTLPRLIEALR